MELKLRFALCTNDFMNVWIEPLWNWNAADGADGIGDEAFELNLYGIEIVTPIYRVSAVNVWIEPLWNWNHGTRW